jgi:predicted GIY-YIG superfamily endonuclease
VTVVYILRCVDDTLYIGHTSDLVRRVAAHNEGIAALFTRERRPVSVVYAEPYADKIDAVRRERQLKRWRRDKKEALIAGDPVRLKRL